MKPVFIEARDIDDAWHQLLHNVAEHGRQYKIDTGSYAGDVRLEFDFVSGFIHNPHVRPLAPRMPEGTSLPRPTTDEHIDSYFADYIMDPTLPENTEYKYATWINGEMLPYPKYCEYTKCPNSERRYNDCGDECEPFIQVCSVLDKECYNIGFGKKYECPEINNRPNTSLAWIINHFKTKGLGNNHNYISISDPWSSLAYERPWKDETERGTSPCLRGLDFKVKDGKLITSIVFRSWDLYGGFPENMGGFTLLNEYVANEIGVDPGPLAFSCAGLHAYGFQLDVVAQRLGIKLENLLKIGK
jgi:thymidylate synthase